MTADDRNHSQDPVIVTDEDVPVRLRGEGGGNRRTEDAEPRVIVRHFEWSSAEGRPSGGITGFVKSLVGVVVFMAVALVALVGVWLLIALGIVFVLVAGLGSLFYSPGRRG